MSKTYEGNEHEALIRAVTRGRESVRSAAARLGVPVSTAYGWLRAAAESGPAGSAATAVSAAAPTFLELVPARPRPAALVVRVGAVEIEVRAGFDAALLQAVVAALTEAVA